ncbi:hypothetical protein [Plantactinospora sp. KBS50]|uniref:hypothetical protein n=1 Tax=Plantactinospora sp. KBS50 TaxID=2024580 RepID=UPI001E399138|nr:hypothetical protein [Plantactinospora sp. KBS50]
MPPARAGAGTAAVPAGPGGAGTPTPVQPGPASGPTRDAAGTAARDAAGTAARDGAGSGSRDGRSHPLSAGVGVVRDAQSELRRQMREKRQLRLASLVVACVVLLAALPLYFGLRTVGRDPVFTSLDDLGLPGWAATGTVDDISGNRWCLMECRLRERITRSSREPDETNKVYTAALTAAGWRPWQPPLCPEQKVDGHYGCWRRDELTLDLWVRKPTCTLVAEPSVPPDGQVQPPAEERKDDEDCAGSQVSLKVRNAVDDDRTRPGPDISPSIEDIDPEPGPS